MMTRQSALLTLLTTLVPLVTAELAHAQGTPPPPPSGAPPPTSAAPPSGATPPNYTPPPPPAGYNAPPGYPPPAPPQSGAPRRRWARAEAGGADVRFEPDESGVRLLNLSGGMPVEGFGRFRHGWYGGYYGWAPLYSPVCDQACATRFAPGSYRLALAKYGGPAVPAYPVFINGPSVLRASYNDRSGLRAAGWVIGITGLVGGIVMIAASARSEEVCDPDGFCSRRETADGPLLAGGIVVLLASGIVGGVLASERDEAHISVEPLRLSLGVPRESLAALSPDALPQGAALALHF